MLTNSTVVAMVAVSDLTAGKKFYGETLGLRQTDENPGGVTYTSGGGKLFMYQAPTAGKNEATSATWEVDDIEAVVADLQGKGLTFKEYDMPGTVRNGAIHNMGPMKAAWFTDPDGNILALAHI